MVAMQQLYQNTDKDSTVYVHVEDMQTPFRYAHTRALTPSHRDACSHIHAHSKHVHTESSAHSLAFFLSLVLISSSFSYTSILPHPHPHLPFISISPSFPHHLPIISPSSSHHLPLIFPSSPHHLPIISSSSPHPPPSHYVYRCEGVEVWYPTVGRLVTTGEGTTIDYVTTEGKTHSYKKKGCPAGVIGVDG